MEATKHHEIEHPTPEEREARGREARRVVPRSSHAEWAPAPDRVDVVTLLESQEQSRLADLVPIRRERMGASAFAFYRGAAAVMAADLATRPVVPLTVQCCGDAHLANFGGFASPERRLVFDINDFDETNPGPFDWDVKRLAASFEIAGRSREFTAADTRALVLRVVGTYREAMRTFAGMRNLDVWYARIDAQEIEARFSEQASRSSLKRFNKLVAKAEGRTSLKAFEKLTQEVDGEIRFLSDPPLLVPLEDFVSPGDGTAALEWLRDQFRTYRRSLQPDRRHLMESYQLVDLARKVVGVGSVGTRCWVALLIGRDRSDPLFMQIKEAEASVLERYAGRSGYANHGQRVVEGQRLLQAASDPLLGWMRTKSLDGVDRDFYVRQLWDWKVSVDLDTMELPGMTVYAQLCGWTLARAHASSGDRIAIAAYLGGGTGFDRAIAEFATTYADQNDRDYARLCAAAEVGQAGAAPSPAG